MDNTQDKQDPLYKEISEACIAANNFATSFIQRTFNIGYARAAAIKDAMKENGLIPSNEKRDSNLRGAEDPFYDEAIAACKAANNFTMSFIQRTFDIGFARASDIKDAMKENGLIPPDEKRDSNLRGTEDPFYDEAIAACKAANDFSVLFVQKQCSIGYARAEAILKAYSKANK